MFYPIVHPISTGSPRAGPACYFDLRQVSWTRSCARPSRRRQRGTFTLHSSEGASVLFYPKYTLYRFPSFPLGQAEPCMRIDRFDGHHFRSEESVRARGIRQGFIE